MKQLKFCICPQCGNLITATAEAAVSCCGKKLSAIQPKKAEDNEKLSVELIENEYFISSGHEMTREHYISFVVHEHLHSNLKETHALNASAKLPSVLQNEL